MATVIDPLALLRLIVYLLLFAFGVAVTVSSFAALIFYLFLRREEGSKKVEQIS